MGNRIIIDGVEVDLEAIARQNRKSQKQDTCTNKRYQYTGDTLIIDGVYCQKIDIQPHASSEITIAISGSQTAVDSIAVSESGGTISIVGNGASGGSNVIIQNSRTNGTISCVGGLFVDGVTIISGGGGVNINTASKETQLSMEIMVPIGTAIECDCSCHYLTVGDIEGDLLIDSSGNSHILVGKIHGLGLDTSGMCDIEVERVEGDVKIDTSGTCNAKIQSGEIDKLNVDVSGMGDVSVLCTARRAHLDVSGMGDIFVSHVVNKPRQHKSGMGSIRVGKIG